MFSPSLCLHDRRNLCSSNLVTLLFLRKISSFNPGLCSLLVWLIKTSLTLKLTLHPQFLIPVSPCSLNSGHWWWHCTGHSLARALCSVLCLSSLGTNPTLPGAGPNTASHWSTAANTASDWRRKWRYLCVYRNTGPHSALSPLSVATVCAAASRRPLRSPPERETQICAERKVNHVQSSYGSKFRREENFNGPCVVKSVNSFSDVLVWVIKPTYVTCDM